MGGSEKLAVHHGFPESGTASAIGTANSQGARPAATRANLQMISEQSVLRDHLKVSFSIISPVTFLRKARVRCWARSLGVGRASRAGRAAFREPMVCRALF